MSQVPVRLYFVLAKWKTAAGPFPSSLHNVQPLPGSSSGPACPGHGQGADIWTFLTLVASCLLLQPAVSLSGSPRSPSSSALLLLCLKFLVPLPLWTQLSGSRLKGVVRCGGGSSGSRQPGGFLWRQWHLSLFLLSVGGVLPCSPSVRTAHQTLLTHCQLSCSPEMPFNYTFIDFSVCLGLFVLSQF